MQQNTSWNRRNGNGHNNNIIDEGSIVQWPAPIGEPGMYGIAGDFVRLVAEHTEADPNAILLSFLAHAGNLLGRHFFIPAGADRHCGNLYLCLVGPTAGGRKGSAIAAAEQFFTRGACAPTMPRILHGISTGEGVIWKVHDAMTKREYSKKTKQFENLPVEENIEEKRILYSLSEFQQNITNMRRPESILSSVLRQAWDKDVIESPSKTSAAKATGAHISMVAGISKEELLLETTAADAQNGTLNRFLFGCCQRSRLLPEGETFHHLIEEKEWSDLQEGFQENIRHHEESLLIRRDEEAQKHWGLNLFPDDGGLYKKLSQLRPGLWGTVTARAAQQVMRLSLITAVINGARRIEDAHQDAAWELWRYCDDSCKYIWGDATDQTAARILQGLRETGNDKGLTKNEVFELFHGHKSKELINAGLAWLSSRGLAYSRTVPTGGRPAEMWFATL